MVCIEICHGFTFTSRALHVTEILVRAYKSNPHQCTSCKIVEQPSHLFLVLGLAAAAFFAALQPAQNQSPCSTRHFVTVQ